MPSLYSVIGMPILFSKIWRPLCSLFVRHGCFLFFKFTLATGVFACAGVKHDPCSKTSESGVDISGENSEKIQNLTSTFDYPAGTGKASKINKWACS